MGWTAIVPVGCSKSESFLECSAHPSGNEVNVGHMLDRVAHDYMDTGTAGSLTQD